MQQAMHSRTLVSRTARELVKLSMAHEDGAFIGAEDDLLQRLSVSRPTLRQAAKIAENDRLISVRRGIRGGFYASRPDAEDAIRTLARYLRLKGATLPDILVASRLVAEEAAGLACHCTDDAKRERLEMFAATIDDADNAAAIIVAESRLARLVAQMSGNPAIELVMAIGYSFGMEEQGTSLYLTAAHREVARKLQQGLCQAILDRDGDIARLMMRRRSVTVATWLEAAERGA